MRQLPDRNLAMELVRVTEAAALASGRWVGRGDKIAADAAAVDAMRLMIDSVSMDGVVVIGEGEKDEAPMLFNGEQVGSGVGPETDVAVDPIDGTTLTSVGQPNALSVIALAPRGSMFFPGAAMYMEKIATGPEAAEAIDIEAPVAENIRQVAKAKGKRPEEVTVTILDRPRHAEMIGEIRHLNPKPGLAFGSVPVQPIVPDVFVRPGPDGGWVVELNSDTLPKVLINQGKLYPRNDEERSSLLTDGFDLDQVLDADTLAAGDDLFFAATGITDGYLLEGVRYWSDGATTFSMVMRSRSGTIRYVKSDHRFEKLERFSSIDYRP